jgi:AcrR family transcriptional regulator
MVNDRWSSGSDAGAAPPARPGPGLAGDRLSRPRSQRAHAAVLEATASLLDQGGLPAATIDAISARSGVSKATIYKHWPSRTAVAAEAFGREMATAVRLPDTGDALDDLAEHVRRVSRFYASRSGEVFAQLLAACVTDPPGAVYFREFFLVARQQAVATLWQRALDQGAVDGKVDPLVAGDLLFGPLIFRLITGHAELTDANASAIAEAALQGLIAKPTRKTDVAG